MFITVSTSGCWDYTEYEDMYMVFAIGIDSNPANPDKILLTIEGITSGKGRQNSQGSMSSSKASGNEVHVMPAGTIPEALDLLQQLLEREIFLGYTSVIIIGETAARTNLKHWLTFFDINPLVRSSAYLLFTPGKAMDVLNTIDIKDALINADKIQGLLRNSNRSGAAFPVRLIQFYKMLSSEGLEPVAPRILVKPVSPKSTGPKDGGSNSEENVSTPGKEPAVWGTVEPASGQQQLSGMAAFHGYRFSGWLNEQESRGLCWIKNQQLKNRYWIKAKISRDDPTMPLIFQIKAGKARSKITFRGGQPTVTISVKATAVVQEYTYTEGLLPPKVIHEMKRKLAVEIKKDIEAAIRKAQQDLRSDILGIGFGFFQQHHREWKRSYQKTWANVFPTIPIRVKVTATVLNTSIQGSSLKEH